MVPFDIAFFIEALFYGTFKQRLFIEALSYGTFRQHFLYTSAILWYF
jgi:hypothetical protein